MWYVIYSKFRAAYLGIQPQPNSAPTEIPFSSSLYWVEFDCIQMMLPILRNLYCSSQCEDQLESRSDMQVAMFIAYFSLSRVSTQGSLRR